jgi:hypothetical protein
MSTARMLLPLGLIAFALTFAAVLAYGTHPGWVQYPFGLSIIMLARRLQWAMVALALIASLTLLVVVISGKRRAWWLIGLAPVLALFAHRFSNDAARHVIADEPQFVSAEQATTIGEEDYVVGLNFGDETFAYPYSALYWTPVVVQTDRDRRLLVMWSAFANSAVATTVSRDIKGRELDIVCEPANALLLYNARIGQFINGLTGRTPGGTKPIGFGERVTVWKGPWKLWKQANPESKVMVSTGKVGGPVAPVLPREPVAKAGLNPEAPVLMLATTRPVALDAGKIGASPCNLRAGDLPVVIFREAASGKVKAFDRRVEADLIPRFVCNSDSKRKGALRDLDTNTCWSAQGVAVDGDKALLGHKLAPVEVQDEVYWGVAKYWWPKLELIEARPEPVPVASPVRPQPAHVARPRRRHP